MPYDSTPSTASRTPRATHRRRRQANDRPPPAARYPSDASNHPFHMPMIVRRRLHRERRALSAAAVAVKPAIDRPLPRLRRLRATRRMRPTVHSAFSRNMRNNRFGGRIENAPRYPSPPSSRSSTAPVLGCVGCGHSSGCVQPSVSYPDDSAPSTASRTPRAIRHRRRQANDRPRPPARYPSDSSSQ